ncbi:Putative ribonuclease H protein At1g65750 [Linum perenne]
MKAAKWLSTVSEAMCREASMLIDVGTNRRIEVSWQAGPHDWVTLNSDGSVLGVRGSSAAGGLITDSSGNCLHAFTINMGVCSITRAEIRGAIESLKLAWEAGFKKIVVQADSSAAISLINAEGHPSHQHAGEVLTIRELMLRECEVVIYHVYREGNHSADFLANLGHSLSLGTHQVPI